MTQKIACPSTNLILPVLLFAVTFLASATTGLGQSKCKPGEFQETYYRNMQARGQAAVTRCSKTINHIWSAGTGPVVGSSGGGKADGGTETLKGAYSASFVGEFSFAGGTYTFYAKADDGVRLWVDNTPLINQWNDHAATEFNQSMNLSPGVHRVKVQYYQNTGDAVIKVWWTPEQ